MTLQIVLYLLSPLAHGRDGNTDYSKLSLSAIFESVGCIEESKHSVYKIRKDLSTEQNYYMSTLRDKQVLLSIHFIVQRSPKISNGRQ